MAAIHITTITRERPLHVKAMDTMQCLTLYKRHCAVCYLITRNFRDTLIRDLKQSRNESDANNNIMLMLTYSLNVAFSLSLTLLYGLRN